VTARRVLGAIGRTATAVLLALLVVSTIATAAMTQLAYRTDIRPTYTKDGLLTILVIGSDIGMPDRSGDPLRGRSDGTHLIAVDPRRKRATIIDFPRDSLIGGTKVNAHMSAGGPEALKRQLEAYTGIPIDFYALTTFRGVSEMARLLGGVEVDVEQRMSDPFSGTSFGPGTIRLDGPGSLAFVRDRKSFSDGDFSRTRNHGRFMRAAHAQIRREQSDLGSLTHLTGAFARNVVTDIPADQLLPLALLATQIPPEHVHQEALSGSTGTGADGASVVHLRPGLAFERIKVGQVGPGE
jgi:LCP family protein required for cell wall assembly